MSVVPSDMVKTAEVLVGPIVIGSVLNVFLLGVMCMQCYVYFYTRNQDPRWIHLLVVFLLIADVFNSVFDVVFTYQYSVKFFGDVEAIQKATWVFSTDPVMTVIISSTVQIFFAWRVQKLTHQRWLSILIVILAIAQFFCGLGTAIACGIVVDFVRFQKFKSIVIVWLVLAPITDTAITLSLVWYLRQHRTGFRETDDIVSRIIRLTVQTGMITAICAIVDLAMYLAFPNNFHLILNLPLCKLYTNSLLSSLNARGQWSTSSYNGESFDKSARGIQVTTTTETYRDLQSHYELDEPASDDGHKLGNTFLRRSLNLGRSRQSDYSTYSGFMHDLKSPVQASDTPNLRWDITARADDDGVKQLEAGLQYVQEEREVDVTEVSSHHASMS